MCLRSHVLIMSVCLLRTLTLMLRPNIIASALILLHSMRAGHDLSAVQAVAVQTPAQWKRDRRQGCLPVGKYCLYVLCMYVCMYVLCMFVCMSYVCMYVCMYVCIYDMPFIFILHGVAIIGVIP
jgi:hypothetical protein